MTFSMPREIAILKSFNRTKFNELMPILFNEVNLDTAFTLFFEKCIRKGNVAKKLRTSDFLEGSGDFSFHQKLVPNLSKSEHLENFDSELGRAILSSWLQASIIDFVPLRSNKSVLVPDLLKLLSVATYRARLPRSNNSSSARGIDSTVYGSLITYLKESGSEVPKADIQAALIKTSISRGIYFKENDYPWDAPEYNGEDLLDITTMLELRLLEQFEGIKGQPSSVHAGLPLDEPLRQLARDFLDITRAFDQVSSDDLLAMYKSVFTLRLYQLPIYLATALNNLRRHNEDNIHYSHKMFVDFSGKKGTPSFEMGHKSAMSDLQAAASLIDNTIFFLTAKSFVSTKSRKGSQERSTKSLSIEDLQELLEFAESDVASITAQTYLETIQTHFESLDDKNSLLFIEETISQSNTRFEALVSLIIADIGKRSRDGYRKWFKNIGGVELARETDTVALLSGTEKTKSWSYSMTDRMLETLINLCFVDENGRGISTSLDLEVLLQRMKKRFGVLVNEVPQGNNTIEAGLAANLNLQEFKKRLRQLSRFESLSDEFEAQYVRSPFRRLK